ncbi:hypothetical protein ACFSOZ_24290 [Mesorhizobium newzealandense]|uniref:Uncharacterized protein n=1 Tax=Mesorhizobium newzealandense TaxID=1300302 RepID=A0ABW4UGQ1_9HYPH
MRHINLGSAADDVAALDIRTLQGLSGIGGERLNAWIAQVGIDGSAVAAGLDTERWLFRNWSSERDSL